MQLGLSDEDHVRRRSGVGGSDAGSIVAGGAAWRELWAVKTGRAKPADLSGNLAVQMGIYTEPLNAHWFERQTGRAVSRRNQFARHPSIPYLFAHLDGMTVTEAGRPAYIDFKHVGKAGEQLMLRYTAQGTHCALVTGVDWFLLSCFIGNSRWELTECEVDPFFAADYLAKARQFWDYVEADEEPPQVGPLPVPPPKRLRVVQLEDAFREEWPNWGPEMARYIHTFASTKPAADLHAITRDKMKALCPEDVGTITRGLFTLRKTRNGVMRMSLAELDDDE